MGDDELNFTEEEAQCWANDPRNQACRMGAVARRALTWFLLLVGIIAVVWLAGSGRSMPLDGNRQFAGLPAQ